MATAAILNLIPVDILTHCRLYTTAVNHHTKFRANISIHDWNIITFCNSRWCQSAMLDFPIPSCIFENLTSEQWIALRCRFSITVPNLVQKCWSAPELWPKIEIQDGGSPPSWIFENLTNDQKVAFGCWSITLPNLVQNGDQRPNYCPNSKFKMAAVRHIGIVAASYKTTHKVSSMGHISLSNFMLIRCIVLKIWWF